MNGRRTFFFLAMCAAAVAAFAAYGAFDLGQVFSLDYLKARQQSFQACYAARPMRAIGIFFAVYVLFVTLALPGAALLSLAGGALFGLLAGTVIVSFASTIGATFAFLISRYFLRDWTRKHFRKQAELIDANIARDGAFYLLSLRLVPIFPFTLKNLLMGLTGIRTWTYYWASQLGMLPATMAYVNAGTQLAGIDSMSDILSPAVLASFAALGLLPLGARLVLNMLKTRKLYRGWKKPAAFDYNLVVIGAGAAGLVAAYAGAVAKARVALVEAGKMGGDCLNTGCVPSKALIRSATFVRQARQAQSFGVGALDPQVDFAAVMARIQGIVARIAPHDSVERYTRLGVDVVLGKAAIVSPWEVEVDGRRLRTRAIVIATGSRPVVPPIPGLREAGFLTSETLWELRSLPRRLLVLGGGPIGCELAQAFARLGSNVTQVERGERILPREDADVARAVAAAMADDGVRILAGHEALRCEQDAHGKRLVVRRDGAELALPFDVLLCAVGRAARTEGVGLEALGIGLSQHGTIETDAFLQTRYPNIYACGDAAGPWQFTHTAAHQAWHAAINGLFGVVKRFKADVRVIPWCTFTSPEAARAGLSEDEARAQGIAFEVTRYELSGLDRAIVDGAPHGFVKVLTRRGSDRILGVAIVAEQAGEMLAEYVLAMKHGIGLNKILGTIHAYPTMSEANKYVAGAWKRAHAPERLLGWARHFHRWRRGGKVDAT